MYGSDIEKHVKVLGIGNCPTVTQVNYFRNRTDDDDDEPSIALVSIVANEPLRVSTTSADLKTGTTKFTVSKVPSSRKIACIFTPEKEGESASSSLSESAKKYVTECIFKQFSEDNEKLFRIDGTCEIFCPMNGTNTGWHRDGFQRGCYVGHALCEEEREDTAVADDVYAADDGAAWFEFALIKKKTQKERARRRRRLTFATRNIFLSNRPTLSPSRLATPSPFSKILKFSIDRLESSRVGTPWNAVGEK